MNLKDLRKLFENAFDSDIAKNLIDSFVEIESNFVRKKWKPSELDAGHFVETVRRLIEEKLFGNYTPFGGRLPNFNDQELQRYERAQGNESYRMLIPRILKSMYNIRNKRGVGHISDISPNEMDSTFILYNAKWVMAELVRLNSNISPGQTQKIIDKIVERNIEVIWKDGEIRMIMDTSLKAKEKVLVLLYDESPLTAKELRNSINYRHASRFGNILRELQSEALIYYAKNSTCKISPKGEAKAEEIIQNSSF